MKIDPQELEDIDKVLDFMGFKLLEMGITYREELFDFEGDDTPYKDEILSLYNWDEEYLYHILRRCIFYNMIKHTELGDELSGLKMTQQGYERIQPKELKKDNFSSNIINVHSLNGPAIAGNHNNQNSLHTVYNTNNSKIAKRDILSSKEEKSESNWQKICKHPMVCTIVGVILTILATIFFLK